MWVVTVAGMILALMIAMSACGGDPQEAARATATYGAAQFHAQLTMMAIEAGR
jgi:hypothetical protein